MRRGMDEPNSGDNKQSYHVLFLPTSHYADIKHF